MLQAGIPILKQNIHKRDVTDSYSVHDARITSEAESNMLPASAIVAIVVVFLLLIAIVICGTFGFIHIKKNKKQFSAASSAESDIKTDNLATTKQHDKKNEENTLITREIKHVIPGIQVIEASSSNIHPTSLSFLPLPKTEEMLHVPVKLKYAKKISQVMK